MIVKEIIIEDFLQYKKPVMFILMPKCSFKCEKECGIEGICQNSPLAKTKNIDIPISTIIDLYVNNDITKAICFGGLEPLDSFDELHNFIMNFRYSHYDPIIIYTGYKEEEIQDKLNILKLYENIMVKFGRFIPNQKPHLDSLLGVELASDNQYARWVSEDHC